MVTFKKNLQNFGEKFPWRRKVEFRACEGAALNVW
jgi:hypothetical protein